MKILILNGPNLNMLGVREPEIYGKATYAQLETYLREQAAERNIEVSILQSNHEGALVDAIQAAYQTADAIIINPAAYTHTSIAIADAIKSVSLPAVEVHLSDIRQRESFRHHSYVAPVCIASVVGEGFAGYSRAMDLLLERFKSSG